MTNDIDLRQRFATLREEAEQGAPDFQSLLRSKRAAPSARRFAPTLAVSVAVAVLAAGILWTASDRARHYSNDAGAVVLAWKTSTDFLLETPGREVLFTIPRIGERPMSAEPLPTLPSAPGWTPPSSTSEKSS